jgi:superfamily I DNA and/or RNA helicase
MSEPARERIVVQFRPFPAQLLLQVQEIAADSSKVMFGDHSLDRMEERGITTLDVLRVLRAGDIKGSIDAGKNIGEWRCKIVKQMKGTREIGVVTIVKNADRLFIKTVEWEDLK